MKKTIVLCLALSFLSVSCSGKKPALGVANGNLLPCPSSPNCVGSQNGDEKHSIAPLTYAGEKDQVFPLFRDMVKNLDGATLVDEGNGYLRFEFRTRVFRFVDDVEFLFSKDGVIDVRSASRLGYSDLGVNRKRIEDIRRRMAGLKPENAQ